MPAVFPKRSAVAVCVVFLLTAAGLGEWKTINTLLYGLPKAFTLGIVALALFCVLVRPDLQRLRSLFAPAVLCFSLLAALLLWSCVIWIVRLSAPSVVLRGCSKLLYQGIAILTAVALVYLFGGDAIDLFAASMCLVNGIILLLELPRYGLVAGLQSIWHCLVTFGDAQGLARALEIHDLTFVFGQLVLYYAAFAPADAPCHRRRSKVLLAASTFFFLLGMKRIAIPAVLLFLWVAARLRSRRGLAPLLFACGVGAVLFFLLFICGIRAGVVASLFETLGIDTMGRTTIWEMAGAYYRFSPFHIGYGFEFVDSIITQWYTAGVLNYPYPFHNDILKVFVELGFPGFLLWAGLQYVAYPVFWQRFAGDTTALLYFCELGYLSVTYLTDNSAFYFWCTLVFRLIVLGTAFRRNGGGLAQGGVPDAV